MIRGANTQVYTTLQPSKQPQLNTFLLSHGYTVIFSSDSRAFTCFLSGTVKMSDAQIHKSTKRKLWADESMINAVKSVQEGKGLREASRLYIMCLLKR